MKINETLFKNILLDLIDENPIACGAVLSVVDIEFTEGVPTLAVTLEKKPRLKVNLAFLEEHTQNETEVKTCLLHEFLHVLLNHTEKFKSVTPQLNLALDAVINHIIQRTCGEAYSDFFRHYYKDAEGCQQWLRPMLQSERDQLPKRPNFYCDLPRKVQVALFDGKLVADDILDLVKDLVQDGPLSGLPAGRYFIGGHEPGRTREEVPEPVREALARTLRSMNGTGIFRSPKSRGIGAYSYAASFRGKSARLLTWEQTAYKVIRNFVTPDPKSAAFDETQRQSTLPVLNASDRRAFVKTLWSPLIPDVHWNYIERKQKGTCQVYLDVSGSMYAEMGAIIGLITALKRYIRTPFWAFSTEVVPAIIEKGILKADTTGGTSMNCVLEHIVHTKPDKAVVITDGYIEECIPSLLKRLQGAGQNIHAIVSRDGSTQELERARITCTQLPPYPGEEND